VPVHVSPDLNEAAATIPPLTMPPPMPAPAPSITIAFGERVRMTIEGVLDAATLANVIGALTARDCWR
jgi:hypothetical protein